MLRSTTVHTIRELAAQGYSIRAIATETGIARNTIRKYLRGTPEAAPRPRKGSKLDPFKDQVRHWVVADRLYNCQTMLERLQAQGYPGGISILKAFVHTLRPPRPHRRPVRRYETAPGEHMQIDWGEFRYEQNDHLRKVYGFTAILGYSRMRFVCFTKRCDTPSLIRCLMLACEYVDGLPKAILTDRMKSVLVAMDGKTPQWHSQFSDFLSAIGVTPRVCRAAAPQTKGKVERSIGIIKQSFWPGVRFTDLHDLNAQAQQWCDRRNQRVHATTRVRPIDRWGHEGLRPLPTDFAWERFRVEDRRVTPDGFISFDGVLYGLPATAGLTGMVVQVGAQQNRLTIWFQGQVVTQQAVHPISGTQVVHPAQFTGVPPARMRHQTPDPCGYQIDPPAAETVQRPLNEYDQLWGVTHPEVAA